MDFASDHVLVADIMKPDAAYGYLATAALRGGSSTGTNVNVSTAVSLWRSTSTWGTRP
jgi:hypothetical protein